MVKNNEMGEVIQDSTGIDKAGNNKKEKKSSLSDTAGKEINYGEVTTMLFVLGGVVYGMKNKLGFQKTAFCALGLGIVGAFIGNAINKYQVEH